MVYSCAYAPLSKKTELSTMGFHGSSLLFFFYLYYSSISIDSKVLTEQQRELLFQKVESCDWINYETDVISPVEISAKMLRKTKVSLNKIAMESVIKILTAIRSKGVVIREVSNNLLNYLNVL